MNLLSEAALTAIKNETKLLNVQSLVLGTLNF
jgi:hypothetical protein